jgi:hypothetical protein
MSNWGNKARLLLMAGCGVVFLLFMLPLVINGVNDFLAIPGVSAYAGLSAVTGLIPLGLLIVGIIILIWHALRKHRGDGT